MADLSAVITPVAGVPFWPAFWPAFGATGLGVVLGIPAGYFLDRLITSRQGSAQREVDKTRRNQALGQLRRAVDGNVRLVDEIAKGQQWQAASFEPALNVSTWEIERDDILRLEKDPDFRNLAGHHFAAVGRVERLLRELNEYTLGVGAAMSSSKATAGHLRTRIARTCFEAGVAGRGVLNWLADGPDGRIIVRHPVQDPDIGKPHPGPPPPPQLPPELIFGEEQWKAMQAWVPPAAPGDESAKSPEVDGDQ